jgi:alpha-galactosidase
MRFCLLVLSLVLPILSSATPQTWTIGNSDVSRTMKFTDATGIATEQLSDLKTHTDYILQPKRESNLAAEFSFQCNGRTYNGAGSQFAFVSSHEEKLPNGKSLTILLRAKDLTLELSLIYTVYDGHPAIRKHLVFHNTGSDTLHLSHLNIESLAPSVGPANETTLNTQYSAIPREIFYTGRTEDVALFVANSRTGIGFAILSEIPGHMKRTEIGGWDDTDRMPIGVLYDTDFMPFERSLHPAEKFQTASVSLLTFRNGDGFRDPHWVLPSYTSEILMRKIDSRGAPWIYNTWEPFERRINRDTVLQLVDVAGKIGIDIFTIDDGWQDDYGENRVNLAAFPGGLKPIQQAIEAKGMRLGLRIPLAAIGTATLDYRTHPEWAALDQNGKPKMTGTAAGEKVVMCLASPFRVSAADRVNQAIEQFHLAYVKLDLTTIFNAYGEVPGCWAKGHDHQTWAESLNEIYEGISFVTRRIHEKHPDVLLDLTFELWGQKHLIDAGLLDAGDLDWMSNVDDNEPNSAGPVQARTLLYQRAISMPADAMLIGNIHAELPTIQESFATEIGSAPLFLGDIRNLTAADQQWYHEKIAWFKSLRANTRINESFFSLGNWMQPSAATWDGFARLDHAGNGIIVLFRNKSNLPSVNVQLPVLPSGRFKLHSIISREEARIVSNSDLAAGVSLNFSASERVEIFEVAPSN